MRIASQFVEDYLDQPNIESKFKNDMSQVNSKVMAYVMHPQENMQKMKEKFRERKEHMDKDRLEKEKKTGAKE